MGEGRGVRGEGQGTFHPPCHILHYHMALRPEGTSHNQNQIFVSVSCGLTDVLIADIVLKFLCTFQHFLFRLTLTFYHGVCFNRIENENRREKRLISTLSVAEKVCFGNIPVFEHLFVTTA